MANYTTKVHSYTLMVPSGRNFNHLSVISVNELDIPEFLKNRGSGCKVVDNGLIDARSVSKQFSPWDTILFGFKAIHTSRDSRGCFQGEDHVPCNWDDNHEIVKKIKGIAIEEAKAQDNYYSRLWV